MQPSASVSTSQGSGGDVARGFKDRKFQPVDRKDKNATGKDTKSSK